MNQWERLVKLLFMCLKLVVEDNRKPRYLCEHLQMFVDQPDSMGECYKFVTRWFPGHATWIISEIFEPLEDCAFTLKRCINLPLPISDYSSKALPLNASKIFLSWDEMADWSASRKVNPLSNHLWCEVLLECDVRVSEDALKRFETLCASVFIPELKSGLADVPWINEHMIPIFNEGLIQNIWRAIHAKHSNGDPQPFLNLLALWPRGVIPYGASSDGVLMVLAKQGESNES